MAEHAELFILHLIVLLFTGPFTRLWLLVSPGKASIVAVNVPLLSVGAEGVIRFRSIGALVEAHSTLHHFLILSCVAPVLSVRIYRRLEHL